MKRAACDLLALQKKPKSSMHVRTDASLKNAHRYLIIHADLKKGVSTTCFKSRNLVDFLFCPPPTWDGVAASNATTHGNNAIHNSASNRNQNTQKNRRTKKHQKRKITRTKQSDSRSNSTTVLYQYASTLTAGWHPI